jgi:hypothetical protein
VVGKPLDCIGGGMTGSTFLRLVWAGDRPPVGLLAVSHPTRERWHTRYFGDVDAAARYGQSLQAESYIRVTSVRRGLSEWQRGTAADSLALPALVADLDVKDRAFRDLDAARSFLAELLLTPSAIVCSGSGLHAWWMVDPVILIDSPENLAEVQQLADRWRGFLRYRAATIGAELDPVADCARVLRLPGTWNRKTDPPRPVAVEAANGVRYPLHRFLDLVGRPSQHETPTPVPSSSARPPGTGGAVPVDRRPPTDQDREFIRLACSLVPAVRALWAGQWRGGRYDEGDDRGPSKADAGLVGHLLHLGADDGRIQRLLRSPECGLRRDKYQSPRPGGDYLSVTVARLLERQAKGDEQ